MSMPSTARGPALNCLTRPRTSMPLLLMFAIPRNYQIVARSTARNVTVVGELVAQIIDEDTPADRQEPETQQRERRHPVRHYLDRQQRGEHEARGQRDPH